MELANAEYVSNPLKTTLKTTLKILSKAIVATGMVPMGVW